MLGTRDVGDTPCPVSVVVPVYNDRQALDACLASIADQRQGRAQVREVLVVDGGSTDGSREQIRGWLDRDGRFRLLDNPARHVPAALNLAIRHSTTEVIVRVDAHTVIAPDYVDSAVEVLDATGADVVGGPMRPSGTTPFGDAVAWALQTRWGIGGSRFHRTDAEGETDSVYMGVFPRRTFERFGMFDERFVRNQDDEFTYRVRAHGGRVWLTPALRSTYIPRGDVRGLARQFHGYGFYKPLVLAEHPSGLRARHLAPPAAAAAWALAPVAVLRRRWAVPAAVHLGVVAAAALGEGRPGAARRAQALLTMHLAYGAGFVRGALALLAARSRAGAGAAREAATAPASTPGEPAAAASGGQRG